MYEVGIYFEVFSDISLCKLFPIKHPTHRISMITQNGFSDLTIGSNPLFENKTEIGTRNADDIRQIAIVPKYFRFCT